MDRQLRGLKQGAQIIVGTPGRLLDHLRRGSFDPSAIQMAVLDEADRMLDMGFRDEMNELLAALPRERQTLFFSATMNSGVKKLIQKFGNEPELIEIEQKARFLDRARDAYRALSGQDLARVEDLVRGPFRVLERLPDPEPDAIPASLRRGSAWQIRGDRIVSSYVGTRYEVHYSHYGGHEGAVFGDEAAAGAEGVGASDTNRVEGGGA